MWHIVLRTGASRLELVSLTRTPHVVYTWCNRELAGVNTLLFAGLLAQTLGLRYHKSQQCQMPTCSIQASSPNLCSEWWVHVVPTLSSSHSVCKVGLSFRPLGRGNHQSTVDVCMVVSPIGLAFGAGSSRLSGRWPDGGINRLSGRCRFDDGECGATGSQLGSDPLRRRRW